MLHDLRLALRSLLRAPGLFAAAVVTMGLGVGLTTGVFSFADLVLLRPLPFRDADRLAVLWQRDTRAGTPVVELSWEEFLEWRGALTEVSGLAAMTATNFRLNLTGRGEPAQVDGAAVSAAFFDVVGLPPARGRLFTAADAVDGAAPAVVLSERFWRRAFGADDGVIGAKLILDGEPATVVGIAPGDLTLPRGADVYTVADGLGRELPGLRVLKFVGRLRQGGDFDRLRAELETFTGTLARSRPDRQGGLRGVATPLPRAVWGDTRPALRLVTAAVTLVLLAACANVAALLLARGTLRGRERAVRLALGAPRGRLLREALAEALVVTLAGALLGVACAYLGLDLLVALAPPDVPRLAAAAVDARALAFALAVSLLAALAAGLLPGLAALASPAADGLREGARGAAGGPRTALLRKTVVVAQVAVALSLLCGAAVVARAFGRVAALEPGFRPEGVLTARLNLGARYPSHADRAAFVNPFLERVRALPGVTGAAVVLLRPLRDPIGWDYPFTVEGQDTETQRRNPASNHESISPDYFRTMGIPLREGRDFDARDDASATPVVIVSEGLAKRAFPTGGAIGRRLKFGPPHSAQPWRTIVGVAGDVRYRAWGELWPDVYVPLPQWSFGRLDLVVRGEGELEPLVPALRAALAAGDPELALADVTTMDRVVAQAVAGPRFTATVLLAFALAALVLCAVSLHGLLAWSVRSRAREIGVRVALGASARDVLRLVICEGARLTAFGLGLGLVLAAAGGRLLASVLQGTSAFDPAALILAIAALCSAALPATALPARAAARVDPARTLRED